jgi:hypothetical protein
MNSPVQRICPNKNENKQTKNNSTQKQGWGCGSSGRVIPGKCEALSSNPILPNPPTKKEWSFDTESTQFITG